jgi:hypothetical protein
MPPPAHTQGNQKQYTEKPQKIYGEQYRVGSPLPIGVSTEVTPPIYAAGEPRVYGTQGVFDVHDTDWVISHRYTGAPIEVISDEEFTDRFGHGGGLNVLPTEE